VPAGLFSHSDQQKQWESAARRRCPAPAGAGGPAQVLATTNPVISVGGNGLFGVEDAALAPGAAGPRFRLRRLRPDARRHLGWEPNRLRKAAVDALYAETPGGILGGAFASQQRVAFEMSDRLSGIVGSTPGDAMSVPEIDAAFAPLIQDGYIYSWFGQQMYQVAKLIAYNATVQGSRQMFFANQGATTRTVARPGATPPAARTPTCWASWPTAWPPSSRP
jgi:hypothetical protein